MWKEDWSTVAASTSSAYYGTGTKTLTSFDNFAGGMYYTSKELPEGYSKTVLNFKHSSDGAILSQRPGLKHLDEMNDPAIRSSKIDIATHFLRHNEFDVYISLGVDYNDPKVYFHHRETKTVDVVPVEIQKMTNLTFKVQTMSYSEVDKYPMNRPIWTPYIPNDSLILLATWQEDGKSKEGMVELWYNTKDQKVIIEPIHAKQPDAQEAISYGFNALSEEPMTFTDDEASVSFKPDVIIPHKYDASKPRNLGDLRLEAVRGEKICFKLYYSCKAHKDYKVKWEYQGEGSETWEVKQDFKAIGPGENGDILEIIPQDTVFSLKVTMKDNTVKDDPETKDIDESLATAKGITYPRYKVSTEGKDYSTLMELDLFKADNLLYYNRQMVLYGKRIGEPNTLFFSDFEDPSYYPYPLKSISFDENITHVHVLGQKLVVFTSNRMYILADSILPEEMGCYLLKDDMSINEMDRGTVRSIGNALYFTVGNQFYLATANKYTEDPGNMMITKISERIDYLLEDAEMAKFIGERIDDSARFKTATPLYKFSYLDKQMVKTYIAYEYVAKYLKWQHDEAPEDSYDIQTYFYTLCINYDTQLRTWELEEVRDSLVYFCYRDNINENIRVVSGTHYYNELAEYDRHYFYDDNHKGKGHPIDLFLDTGVRAIDPYRKKRFKLFSLQLHNVDETEMAIKFEFRVDGQTRQSFRNYHMVWHDQDPSDPKYGTIEWTFDEEYNLHAPGATYLDKWKLDLSRFAGVERVKLNHRISGQGYFPQAIIKGSADRPFEFLGYGFVYKPKKAK